MLSRTALLAATALLQATLGIVVAVPRVVEATADAKLSAVIAELDAPPPGPGALPPPPLPRVAPPSRATATPPVPLTIVTSPAPSATETSIAPTTTSTTPPLTRHAVEARPASPGAAPPAVVAADVEDAFGGKGVARASADQQVMLAKAVCSAFDQGYSREEIIDRALEEDGTTASGIDRFIDVAVATMCPEHANR